MIIKRKRGNGSLLLLVLCFPLILIATNVYTYVSVNYYSSINNKTYLEEINKVAYVKSDIVADLDKAIEPVETTIALSTFKNQIVTYVEPTKPQIEYEIIRLDNIGVNMYTVYFSVEHKNKTIVDSVNFNITGTQPSYHVNAIGGF